ncbi:MAG TPA: DUF177 domain-containing protein [Rhodothermales bacterium]|nr:DUF177 domain-containing protein [Rhodothermales bacterium]
MLRIDLTPFSNGVHQVTLEPDAQTLDLDPDRFADIEVDVVLDIRHDQVLVTLDAAAVATLACDRTLVLFDQPIAGSYSLLFSVPSRMQEADDEDPFAEVQELPRDRTIDLTDAVRDTLMLAIPVRKVAPEAEDQEIPTAFGAPEEGDEPAIDPRWEALKALRTDDDS